MKIVDRIVAKTAIYATKVAEACRKRAYRSHAEYYEAYFSRRIGPEGTVLRLSVSDGFGLRTVAFRSAPKRAATSEETELTRRAQAL